MGGDWIFFFPSVKKISLALVMLCYIPCIDRYEELPFLSPGKGIGISTFDYDIFFGSSPFDFQHFSLSAGGLRGVCNS